MDPSKVDVYLKDLFKIPDQKGIMIISEDGTIIASYGDMVNDIATGNSILSMYQIANKMNINKSCSTKRMSLYFHDHVIVVTSANKRVYIVKKSSQLLEESPDNSLGHEKLEKKESLSSATA